MNTRHILRSLVLALAVGATGTAVMAEGDIYSRLFEMKQMDRNKDGMVSKDEFLAMVAKTWDMQAADMKVKGKMTPEQIKELEKLLGRTLSSLSGT
jgi:hypothetical protein